MLFCQVSPCWCFVILCLNWGIRDSFEKCCMSSVLSFPAQLLLYASSVNCVDQKFIFKKIKITCGAFSHLPVGR